MTLIDMPLPIALILATGSELQRHIFSSFSLTSVAMLGFGNSITGAILTSVSSGYMAISIPVLFITLYFLQKFYLRTSHQLRSLDLEAKSPLLEHFMETLQGLTTIRALSWTDHLVSDAFHQLDQSQKPFYLLLCIQRWLTLVLNCVVACLAVVLMTLTATLRDNINSGLLGVSMVSVVNFGQTLSSFISYWTTLETSLTAIARIQNYVVDTPGGNTALQTAELPSDWPVEPRIKIQHMSASYQWVVISAKKLK
jgi:ATP-binding cassette, subfamily C (CFTR/MRP), member 1